MSRRLTIGFLACDIAEEVSRALWQGAAEAARELGVNLICYPGGALRDPLGYRKQSNVLYSLVDPRRVDGIILVSSSIDFAASRAEMETFIRQFEGLPLVSIEEEFPGIPSLLKDEFGGMAQVVDHLIATHSRRKIVFMQGPGSTLYTQKRFQAYQETLSAHGLPFDPNQAWDERREAYMMSGDIVKTRNVTQTAECGPDGLWTTVVAALVYVEYHE